MSDAKLLNASARIRAVLDELDIAGHVILHNKPGSLEVLTKLDPSYSNIKGLPPYVRLRSNLADYKGDKAAQLADLEATANLISGFAQALGMNAMMMLELAHLIDAKTGATHGPLKPDPGAMQ